MTLSEEDLLVIQAADDGASVLFGVILTNLLVIILKYLTNGDEKNKNLKYFQGAIEKDILMEKLKEWHVELSEDEL